MKVLRQNHPPTLLRDKATQGPEIPASRVAPLVARRPSLVVGFSPFQIEPKSAPFPRLGTNAYASAHFFSSFLHDGQPDPGALVLAIQPFKNAKDSFLRLFLDSNAVVFEIE